MKSELKQVNQLAVPEILAPAGDETAFLAALAAGSDAIYCGLKQFSARQAARNMTVSQLARLTKLAHQKNTKVYVAFNTLLSPKELPTALEMISAVMQDVKADALIFQDLAIPALARKAGFKGELHLSTLANASHTGVFQAVSKLGISRVVVPRELSVDELKIMNEACPKGVSLEVFVHGALCYGISGRCYWSSFMGGRSGLRGACVQPCRRMYRQGAQKSRAYSCADLGLDALVKVLKKVEKVSSWKIEGRKKGPHYVYYTTMAYQILRDHGEDPTAKKEALGLLEMALGRERTHYGFLSHRPWHPIPENGQTASGLWVGSIRQKDTKPVLSVRENLLAGDLLRIGTEDEPWHEVVKVFRSVPKGGTFSLKTTQRVRPPSKTAVFLVDRREPELMAEIETLQKELAQIKEIKEKTSTLSYTFPKRMKPQGASVEITVVKQGSQRKRKTTHKDKSETGVSVWGELVGVPTDAWIFLPPVVFVADEEEIRFRLQKCIRRGHRKFMLGDPWQISWFDDVKKLDIWAGPFCNLANPESVLAMAKLGVKGVIASPELGGEDYMQLADHAPILMGLPEKGWWPVSISRVTPRLKEKTLFESPRKEGAFWMERDGLIWTYPNWEIDFTPYRADFENAGYRLFIHYEEMPSERIPVKKRPGLWNLHTGLT